MTDIKRLEERLRLEIKYCRWPEQANLLTEAVYALTQLQAERDAALKEARDCDTAASAYRAETKRLQAENERLQNALGSVITSVVDLAMLVSPTRTEDQ